MRESIVNLISTSGARSASAGRPSTRPRGPFAGPLRRTRDTDRIVQVAGAVPIPTGQLHLWGPPAAVASAGALIHAARLRAGITQSVLAGVLGTTQGTVSRLESGALTLTYDDLIIIAATVQTSVVTLLGTSPPQVRCHSRAGRPPRVSASRSLANGLSPDSISDFVALGGSLRALRAAREGRQALSAGQTAILLSLGAAIRESAGGRG